MLEDALKLINSEPKGLPILTKEITDQDLFKLVTLNASFKPGSEEEKHDPITFAYFNQISHWLKLATPPRKK